MTLLLDGLKTEQSMMRSILDGVLSNQMTCLICGSSSTTTNKFNDLSLHLKDGDNLEDIITNYWKSEELQEGNLWYCDKCKEKKQSTKEMSFSTMPKLLILHLKRFSFSKKNKNSEKDNKVISFPASLALSPTADNGTIGRNYSLTGFVVHVGEFIETGHYVAFVKVTNNQSQQNE
jgi:ubiquitin C-terminal hydrolase